MAISKLIFNNVTQMDDTGNTIANDKVLNGYIGKDAAGETVTGNIGTGSATPASSISATGASVSTGTNTLTLTKSSVSNTPQVTAGYISSGTAGNSSVSLTASVTTKGATTFHPSSTDQTISNGTYTTGTQTFKAVTTSNLTAANIKKDIVVKVGDSSDDDCVTSVTGTYEGSGGSGGDAITYYSGDSAPSTGLGSNGDLYLQTDSSKSSYWQLIPDNLPNDGATRLGYYMDPDTPSNRMTAYIRCTPSVAAGVTIDWGDGTTTTTNSTSATNYSHTYTALPANGYYIQTITCTQGTVSFVGSSSYSIWGANSASGAGTTYYNSRVRWAVMGTSCIAIGTYAFCRSYALEEVQILNNNCSLDTYAFYYCYGLKRINIPTNSAVSSIPNYCFNYCYGLGEIEIPANIVTIGSYAFDYCYNLKPIIKGTLTSIGTYAFRYCRSIQTMTLSSNATFNTYALAYCSGLTKLTIPATTTTINAYAFGYCYSLGEIHFKGATPPTMSATTAYASLPTSCKIYVPAGKLSTYTGASSYPSSSSYTYVEE